MEHCPTGRKSLSSADSIQEHVKHIGIRWDKRAIHVTIVTINSTTTTDMLLNRKRARDVLWLKGCISFAIHAQNQGEVSPYATYFTYKMEAIPRKTSQAYTPETFFLG